MAIPFTCPYCEHQTDVDQQYAGQSGPCSSCGSLITIPLSEPGETVVQRVSAKATKSPARKRSLLVIGGVSLIAFVALTLLAATIVLPAIAEVREGRKRDRCAEKMALIGEAMLAYHDQHGHFPPAMVTDGNGKPMHSWRVLLLPYLGPEAEMVYERYNENLPWNDPQNAMLANAMPSIYRCPSDDQATADETSFLLVTGQNAVFDMSRKTRRDEITDGQSTTLLMVESTGSQVNWLEPRDIRPVDLAQGINNRARCTCRSEHGRGVNALFANGEVHYLHQDSYRPEHLHELATKNGGELVVEFD